MDIFSERLKDAMAIRGMRQVDLSEKTGIEKGAISAYCKGRYKPKEPKLQRIANALGVNGEWLLGIDGVPMEKKYDYLVEEDSVSYVLESSHVSELKYASDVRKKWCTERYINLLDKCREEHIDPADLEKAIDFIASIKKKERAGELPTT